MVAGNPGDVPDRPHTQVLRNTVLVSVLVIAVLSNVVWHRTPVTQHHEITSLSAASATYVGAESCATCHAQEAETWRQSHHAQAMQQGNASTVLGNFRDGQFAKDGLTSSFYLRDGKPYVRTEGPDGKLDDYPIAYTFGIIRHLPAAAVPGVVSRRPPSESRSRLGFKKQAARRPAMV